MSKQKAMAREKFRSAVFKRDKNKCRVCGRSDVPLDAHHITNRNEMPNGGYVLENGITLCNVLDGCHMIAEEVYFGRAENQEEIDKYSPEVLYKLIGSSKELAIKKSEEL